MGFFCGVLSLDGGAADFNELRRICRPSGSGCAYAGREFCVIYSGDKRVFEKPLQPATLENNGHLYTAVMISAEYPLSTPDPARELLARYFESGENCFTDLDIPFSALIYDGRCGELLACRSSSGDVPLFCAKKDGRIYFSSALFPLYKLFGGCIRVNIRALREYLCSDMTVAPAALFCDIRPIARGKGVLCTRFGDSDVDIHTAQYSLRSRRSFIGIPPSKKYSASVGEILTEALFAYGYPQFDCYMPSFICEARRASDEGLRALRIQDATAELREYSLQRAYILSEFLGMRILPVESHSSLVGKRALRLIEKQLDDMLEKYLENSSCVLYSVFDGSSPWENNKKSIPSRIRTKGMLCQTVQWFEHFNIVAE